MIDKELSNIQESMTNMKAHNDVLEKQVKILKNTNSKSQEQEKRITALEFKKTIQNKEKIANRHTRDKHKQYIKAKSKKILMYLLLFTRTLFFLDRFISISL